MPDSVYEKINTELGLRRAHWLPQLFQGGKWEDKTQQRYLIGDLAGSEGKSVPIPIKPKGKHDHFADFANSSKRGVDDLELFSIGSNATSMREGMEKAALWLGYAIKDMGSIATRPVPGLRLAPVGSTMPRPALRLLPKPNGNGELPPDPLQIEDQRSDRTDGSIRPDLTSAGGAPNLATSTGHWTYADVQGLPWLEVSRFDPGGGRRKFFLYFNCHQGLWVGDAEKLGTAWGGSLPENERPMFNLDAVSEARDGADLLIVAGEKCAQRGTDLGFLTTTSIGGEGSIHLTDWSPAKRLSPILWRDADHSGEVWQPKLVEILTEMGCRAIRTVDVEGRPKGWDIADATEDEAHDLIAKARVAEGQVEPMRFVDWPSLMGRTPPPQLYIVDQLLPEMVVGAIFGLGGTGKTMLGQSLVTCCTAGRDFLGIKTKACRAMAVLCEDPWNEVWRRQDKINWKHGVHMDELRDLMIDVRRGRENILARLDPKSGMLMPGPFMPELRYNLKLHRPELVVIDNILQVYQAPLNDPVIVTHFVNMLSRLCEDYGCTILLLGHVSKAQGSEFLGAQAWSDAVRSRMFLAKEKPDPDEPAQIFLSNPKANYSEAADDQKIELQWEGGVLVPRRPSLESKMDREVEMGRRCQIFLDALDKLNGNEENSSPKQKAGNYAPRLFRERRLHQGLSETALAEVMHHLMSTDKIRAGQRITTRSKNIIRGLARTIPLHQGTQ